MKLSESGESRVRGYLYVFERSLRSFLAPKVAADAVREVESHIRDAVAQAGDAPDELDALERILTRLGPPMKVAQAYSLELVMDEAQTTGRLGPVFRSLFQTAATGITAFLGAFALFTGYSIGLASIAIAILKPIFPENVGIWMHHGVPVAAGGMFPPPASGRGWTMTGGYAIIPLFFGLGLVLLVVTHWFARKWIGRLRARQGAGNRGQGSAGIR
jgi:uncharacterized membrane protein